MSTRLGKSFKVPEKSAGLTGREGHLLGAPGQNDVGFAQLDLLCGVDDSLESTTAEPVHHGREDSSQREGRPHLNSGRGQPNLLTVTAGTSIASPLRWPTCRAKYAADGSE